MRFAASFSVSLLALFLALAFPAEEPLRFPESK